MLRKLLLSAVVAVGSLAAFAVAPKAEAEPFHHHHHHHSVFYRCNCSEPWAFYGQFEHYESARHAAYHLRERGFETFIR
jgi:hypothetical protein